MEGALIAAETLGKEERKSTSKVGEIPLVLLSTTLPTRGDVMDELIVVIGLRVERLHADLKTTELLGHKVEEPSDIGIVQCT
jgi:hypothetical protein